MKEDRVCFQGSSKEIDDFLCDYFDEEGIRLVKRNIMVMKKGLDETECLDMQEVYRGSGSSGLGLMIKDTDYFINVKKTSLALFGLILDVQFTKGFASFALAMFGVAAEKIRKLSYDEKQILLWINADQVIISSSGEYYINVEYQHPYSSEKIKEIVDQLVKEEIVIRDGRTLKIQF